MSSLENSMNSFETLVRTSMEAWVELHAEFKELFRNADAAVVYGLPNLLIDA